MFSEEVLLGHLPRKLFTTQLEWDFLCLRPLLQFKWECWWEEKKMLGVGKVYRQRDKTFFPSVLWISLLYAWWLVFVFVNCFVGALFARLRCLLISMFTTLEFMEDGMLVILIKLVFSMSVSYTPIVVVKWWK